MRGLPTVGKCKIASGRLKIGDNARRDETKNKKFQKRRAGARPHLERAMLAAALAGAVSAELELRRVGVVEGRAARRRHRERAENVNALK